MACNCGASKVISRSNTNTTVRRTTVNSSGRRVTPKRIIRRKIN